MPGPDDVVLVYLAGHGLQGFFVPTDSDGYHHRVEYDEIKSRLANCEAHQKLVIADACYSGSLLAAKTPMFESVDLFIRNWPPVQVGPLSCFPVRVKSTPLNPKAFARAFLAIF